MNNFPTTSFLYYGEDLGLVLGVMTTYRVEYNHGFRIKPRDGFIIYLIGSLCFGGAPCGLHE